MSVGASVADRFPVSQMSPAVVLSCLSRARSVYNHCVAFAGAVATGRDALGDGMSAKIAHIDALAELPSSDALDVESS